MTTDLGPLASDFVGLETSYRTGRRPRRRHYLDSAATTLMMRTAQDVSLEFLKHHGNPHTTAHSSARSATAALHWARDVVRGFLGADDRYTALFMGAGSTACANRLAFSLARSRPGKPLVLVSSMEHHSNDLPHRRHSTVLRVPLATAGQAPGAVAMDRLEELLARHSGQVNYVAVTGASNVTGLVNPIHDIAELAHRHGALVVVDGAQMVAHMPVRLAQPDPRRDIDAFFFSGHKAYAPGSPGGLVVKTQLLAGCTPLELGGGIVRDVTESSYALDPDGEVREQAGTPNVTGTVTLAAALAALGQVGMEAIQAHEQRLLAHALERLAGVPGLEIYGPTDLAAAPRVGCISFNLRHMEHALVATALNDDFNVSVRDGCFCAHPYVRVLLKESLQELEIESLSALEIEHLAERRRGMVRASFGLYTTETDIDALVDGLAAIGRQEAHYRGRYDVDAHGARPRNAGAAGGAGAALFSPQAALEAALGRRRAAVGEPQP
ncbi:aminotransferase class V-fold PLP-dependent enzyme [Ramlibacter sp.]|uniref:aminotransferase class V-fold PLP-dependent enzyme n=1 Tax=Ramlibacter sp. TaxID=1917967 RepID=UPI00180EB430|nr:aminotransferase class V-fold PLP-dependent enzyme [Ramlibacter sp.]MBA2675450.1 aminotransferase class V-fold PLP-dependent enzyme [Ramlibacter sp.]